MTETAKDSNGSVVKDAGAAEKDIGLHLKTNGTTTSCNGEKKKGERKGAGVLESLNLVNPFVNSLAPDSSFEKIQVQINSLLLRTQLLSKCMYVERRRRMCK